MIIRFQVSESAIRCKGTDWNGEPLRELVEIRYPGTGKNSTNSVSRPIWICGRMRHLGLSTSTSFKAEGMPPRSPILIGTVDDVESYQRIWMRKKASVWGLIKV